MRRLAALLSVLCLTAAGAGVLTAPSAGAGVPGETSVFLANAFSYAGGHPFDGTFCVDGTIVGTAATEVVSGPVTVSAGHHIATFYDSAVADCTGDPQGTFDGTFPDEGTVTLMGYWGDTGQALEMLDNPLDCVDVGSGRLTVRNGSGFGDPSDVDIYGTVPGGGVELLLSGIESGDQGSVDLPVGSYADVYAVPAGESPDTDAVVGFGTIEVAATSGAYAYLYGGNDGSVGSFLGNPDELNACDTPTTTAPATTTTAAAKPADAVATAPAFTG